MRPYTKTVPPAELLPWQGSGSRWEDFAHDAASYQSVQAALQAEQQHLCCYCETGLAAANSHIEHFQPRLSYMVQTLNLDCPRLTNMRRSHAAGLQSIIQGMIDAGAIDRIDDLALFYLTPNDDGKLQSFFSLSRQIFGDRAEAVLGLLEE